MSSVRANAASRTPRPIVGVGRGGPYDIGSVGRRVMHRLKNVDCQVERDGEEQMIKDLKVANKGHIGVYGRCRR